MDIQRLLMVPNNYVIIVAHILLYLQYVYHYLQKGLFWCKKDNYKIFWILVQVSKMDHF